MTVTATFAPGTANELVLDESNFISLNPVLTHSGKADLRAELEERRDLDEYAQRKDRMNLSVDGEVIFTGYVIGTPHNERSGTTTLRADGIFMRLEETRPDYEAIGGPVEYTSTALHDAIRDYWSRTPFDNFTVTDQSTTIVANDEPLQSADTTTEWGNITSIPETTPVVVQNGNLELAQTSFTTEGENPDSGSGSGSAGVLDEYSGGVAVTFDGTGDVTYSITPDHTIPGDQVGFYVRINTEGLDGTEVIFEINGEEVDRFPQGSGIQDPIWRDVATGAFSGSGYSNTDLSENTTHDFRIRSGSAGGVVTAVDVVAPQDLRFSYTYDNSNDGGGGYLDGPELYPSSYEFALDDALTDFNIVSADITTTWNDTSNNQALAVSNDGGANYISQSNTSTLSANFTDAGRTAKTKFTFSRYGSRTTATPQTGFNGQVVQDYTLTADLNDLVVIDSLELSRDHFSNIQKLHDYGDFVFTIDHTSDSLTNIPVYSFQRGEETRTPPSEWDNPENIQPEVKADDYFNSVYLEGALRNDGTRPTAEVTDSTAISNDGREIQAFLRDSSITTEAGGSFRANALLQASLSQNDLEGTITSPPGLVTPGFAYSVDFGEGPKDKTLESISLNKSNDTLRATNEFTVREGFSREIDELKRNQRDQGDQV